MYSVVFYSHFPLVADLLIVRIINFKYRQWSFASFGRVAAVQYLYPVNIIYMVILTMMGQPQ